MSIENLPKAKWSTAGNQVILKTDFVDVEQAVLDSIGYVSPPPLSFVADGLYKNISVLANAGSPARLLLSGFPDVLHPGQFVNPTDSDGTWRENTVDETLDISADLWGVEKPSQWYAVFATSPDGGSGFSLKAMPLMRAKTSIASQIKTYNNIYTAFIKYGFTADEFIDSYVYFLSGGVNTKGISRIITTNGEDADSTTIDYDGTNLSIAGGEWFVILPSTNYRWLGDVFNDSGSALLQFIQEGAVFRWYAKQSITSTAGVKEDIKCAPPLATMALISEEPVAASEVSVYVSHPTYTIQKVLLYQGIDKLLHHYDGDGHHTYDDPAYVSTYAPGPCPVPVELCKYNVTAASALYSNGYGYAKIL